MRYKIIGNTTELVGDGGPWFDTAQEAIQFEIDRINEALPAWQQEAESALARNELHRGGGILSLADLMRRRGTLVNLLAQYDGKRKGS